MAPETLKKARKSRGQALVEFGLILPVLLLALFGVVDFGWMIFNYAELWNGLREALRYASVAGYTTPPQYFQCDAIRTMIVQNAGTSGIQPSDITIKYDKGDPNNPLLSPLLVYPDDCPAGGNAAVSSLENGYRIEINVSVNVPFLTPLLKPFAPDGLLIQIHGARSIYPYGF